MANYLPIFILIGLTPLGFLAIACYSTAQTQRLSECRLLSCFRTRRSHQATDASKTTTDDLEMQTIIRAHGPYPPSNHDLHRSAALLKHTNISVERKSIDQLPAEAINPKTVQHHRAAALALLEHPCSSSSSSSSRTVTVPDIPPRPNAPSPPSSTASSGRYYRHSRHWWEDVADSDGEDEGVALESNRGTPTVPGGISVLGLETRDEQSDGWTEVNLR